MYERLLDRSAAVSAEVLEAFCGENAGRFRSVNDALTARYGTLQEIRFPYGKSYGWCITHRRNKKLVCDIFAEDGAFTVMLRLSDAQFASAYPTLLPYTQAYIDKRYPCGDGGWIHYRVTNEEQLKDAEALLDIKCGSASVLPRKG